MGEVCPVSLLPIQDINPSFAPCDKPHSVAKATRSDKGKGKAVEKSVKEGILSFFGRFITLNIHSRHDGDDLRAQALILK